MPQGLLKFRCYNCDKLLGVAPSKAGRTTACPSCKAELLIPEPDEPDPEPPLPSFGPAIDVTEPSVVREAKRSPAHEPGFTWEGIDATIFEAGRAEPAEIEVTPRPPLEVTPGLFTPRAEPAILPEIKVDVPPVRTERMEARRATGDVVLSREVLASWSLFAPIALALAFLAGLLCGHYVWKP